MSTYLRETVDSPLRGRVFSENRGMTYQQALLQDRFARICLELQPRYRFSAEQMHGLADRLTGYALKRVLAGQKCGDDLLRQRIVQWISDEKA